MQPYLFPYIGYFQLINAVDRFILYDDVQFIKEGWIHRNRLLVSGQPRSFTIPIQKESHTAKINERMIAPERWKKDRRKLLAMIRQSYGKALYFKQAFELIEACLLYPDCVLADFIENALTCCCNYLGISTDICRSSSLAIGTHLSGQERLLEICRELHADHYINPIGGQELYDRKAFSRSGIELSFIKTKDICYPQFANDFIQGLSIIDIMMFTPPDRIREFLNMYELV
jgi:hypothetical protein